MDENAHFKEFSETKKTFLGMKSVCLFLQTKRADRLKATFLRGCIVAKSMEFPPRFIDPLKSRGSCHKPQPRQKY